MGGLSLLAQLYAICPHDYAVAFNFHRKNHNFNRFLAVVTLL